MHQSELWCVFRIESSLYDSVKKKRLYCRCHFDHSHTLESFNGRGVFLVLALSLSHSQLTDTALEGDDGLDSTRSSAIKLPSLIFLKGKVYNSGGAGGVISFQMVCVLQKKKFTMVGSWIVSGFRRNQYDLIWTYELRLNWNTHKLRSALRAVKHPLKILE